MSIAMTQQNCPLCSRRAECKSADHGKRLTFNCATCSNFQISVGAIKRLNHAPDDWKSALSAQAKNHHQGSTLVITLPTLQDESNAQALETAYLKDDELAR